MKLVRPEEKQPKNVVQFKVPTGMTNYDIQNYLEKIYKVKVIKVESYIENGKTASKLRTSIEKKTNNFL